MPLPFDTEATAEPLLPPLHVTWVGAIETAKGPGAKLTAKLDTLTGTTEKEEELEYIGFGILVILSVDAPDDDMTLKVIVMSGVPPTKSIPSAKINSAQLNVSSLELNRLVIGDEVPIVKTVEDKYVNFVKSQLRLKSSPLISVKLELA
jgi:hypothetical protein